MNTNFQSVLPDDSVTLHLLNLADAGDEIRCGGKAAGLARAIELGLQVPEGIVVTNQAFESFLEQQDLGPRIDSLLSDLPTKDFAQLKIASQKISDWVTSASLPHAIHAALVDLFEGKLKGQTLIVRSSAVGEDSKQASFAGQLDSFLDIGNIEDLESALKQCWASRWSERVLPYQLSTGTQLGGMGVVIQRQVDSKIAGVLFTQPPLEQDDAESPYMLGEFCHGQGVSLVSGQINPGRFRIFKKDFSWEKLSDPEQPGIAQGSTDITSDWVQPLVVSALKLETHYQWPQDIEWSVDDSGILYIVQSRPIVKHPVTTDSGPMITWSNANVRENFPDPISPLLYSVASAGYSNYFRNLGLAFGISRQRIEAMEGPLTNIIGVHGARIYYNLSSIHSVIRMAPFGDWLIKYFNSFVGATETPPPLAGDRMFKDLARNRGVQLLETIRIIVKTSWQFLFIGRRITRFESRIDHFAESTRPALLENLDLVQLRDALRAFMEIRLNRWTEASLADTAAMICYGILNSLLKTTFRDDSHGVLANNLLKGVTGLVSSEPVFELWKLSRIILQDEDLRRMFEQQSNDQLVNAIRNPGASANLAKFSSTFDEYLENWGFRCSGELMLTVPSFQENPAGLIQIIKTYMDVKGESPIEILQQQQSARKRQTIEALAQISCDRKLSPLGRLRTKLLIRLFLKWTQDAIGMRERARLKQALLYSRLRRVLLCIGNSMSDKNLLAHADDIFFLTYQEIDQLASSRAMFPDASTELVEMRREEFERLGAMDMPDSFVMEEGTYLYPNNIGIDSDTDFIDANIDYLEGTTACGGKIKGRATVLKDVTQADQLDAGDILITTQTDPGWGHVFFLIKGLIIERGGMLSHGAILAREFGIPAVVGVRNATERIPQHATVVLDADEGKIYVSR